MCGIVGYSGIPETKYLYDMNRVQHHRGPDEEGYAFHEDGLVHLAMKRLSIQDLEGGHQPMYTPDKRYCIVFNGEIFNAPELRKNLESKGYVFQTRGSDTEVLLLLYRDKGEKMLDDLNGMFAFVIHDRDHNILFGARDMFGIKPLHYSLAESRFAFASELKSLLQLPWIGRALNKSSVRHYLSTQTIPAPGTIYASVSKLPVATAFRYYTETGQFRSWKYWQPEFGTYKGSLQPEDLKKHIRTEFQSAVNRWMLSDVPVASSLSGGIDSTLVTACAVKSGGKLSTFSLGFPDMPWLDERDLAEKVARKWDTDHHEIPISGKDLTDNLPAMIHALDEPYAGGLPSWFVFEAIHKAGFKVALTGSGGDELFGNYAKWKKYADWSSFLKQLRTTWRYRKADLKDILFSPHGVMYYPYFNDGEKDKYLFSEKFRNSGESTARLLEKIWDNCPSASPRDKIAWTDMQVQLPEEFLFMTDRFSMAHSLEARTPFLDKKFVSLIQSIPAEIRTKPDDLKYLLKESMLDMIPADLLTAPKKGFVLPMLDWMRTVLRPQVELYLGADYLRKQGIFNPLIFERYTRPFLEGRKHPEWELWTLLMFQLWYQGQVDSGILTYEGSTL